MTDVRMMVLALGAKGYTCAQMLIIGALRLMGRENSDLVRAVGGLAQGAGCGELCGALSGGVCLLSLYTGKGLDSEMPHNKGELLNSELTDWFADELCQGNGMTCAAILNRIMDSMEGCNASDKRRRCETHCINMVVKAWEKCLELLKDNGFELTEGRNLEISPMSVGEAV